MNSPKVSGGAWGVGQINGKCQIGFKVVCPENPATEASALTQSHGHFGGLPPPWTVTGYLAFLPYRAAWGVVGKKDSLPDSHPGLWGGDNRNEDPRLMLKLLKAHVPVLLLLLGLQHRG